MKFGYLNTGSISECDNQHIWLVRRFKVTQRDSIEFLTELLDQKNFFFFDLLILTSHRVGLPGATPWRLGSAAEICSLRPLCTVSAADGERGYRPVLAGCYSTFVTFSIELEQEDDGRWLAEVP